MAGKTGHSISDLELATPDNSHLAANLEDTRGRSGFFLARFRLIGGGLATGPGFFYQRVSKFQSLQGLRFVSATLVVISHALLRPVQTGVLPARIVPLLEGIGGIGVATFFIISGFILMEASRNQFGADGASRKFLLRRLVRIVPMYWLATMVRLFDDHIHGTVLSVTYIVGSFLFIPVRAGPGMEPQPVLTQGWTLNYEMFFYLMFALALLWRRPVGAALLLAACASLASIGGLLPADPWHDGVSTALAFYTSPMILLFAIGVVIGVAYSESAKKRIIGTPLAWSIVLIVGAIAVIFALDISHNLPFPAMCLAWLPSIIAVGLCVFATPAAVSLSGRAAGWLGDASYSTYLFHSLIIAAVGLLFPPLGLTSTLVFVVTAVVAANVFGLVVFELVERPLHVRLKRFV